MQSVKCSGNLYSQYGKGMKCMPPKAKQEKTITCYVIEVWDYLTWDSGIDKNLVIQKSKGKSRRDVKIICLAQEDLGQ